MVSPYDLTDHLLMIEFTSALGGGGGCTVDSLKVGSATTWVRIAPGFRMLAALKS